MNGLNIGERILRLRKEKNITQEQLANMVGVSSGAVSKWETGNSTPDILLLSPLARALNTTPDSLLSFRRELSEDEVNNIKKELTDIFLYRDYESGEEKAREYLNEYPNSVYLKLTIAGLINMYAMMAGDSSDEFVKSKMKYSLSLSYEVVESREPKYTPHALFLIASIEMTLENLEESERAFKELSSSFIDPMVLYPSLLLRQGKYREAEKLCQGMLLSYLNQSIVMMSILSSVSKKEGDYKKAAFYLDAVNRIEGMFKIGLSSGAFKYCQLYIETGEKELAAKWFKSYVKGIISSEYDYHSNPYFENIELEINPEGQKIVRKKLLESLVDNPELKVLEGIQDYEDAVRELRAACWKR